jgi:hypothetical protein
LRAADALQNSFESPLCARDEHALSREKIIVGIFTGLRYGFMRLRKVMLL